MTLNRGLLTSNSDEWTTPRWLFDKLDAIFHFDLDAAATAQNALCTHFFDKESNGLLQSWGRYRSIFCNPPYSQIKLWAEYIAAQSVSTSIIVALIPARTDTAWWNDFIVTADIIRFIRGRLRFGDAKSGAPFPSAVAVWLGLEEALRRPKCPL